MALVEGTGYSDNWVPIASFTDASVPDIQLPSGQYALVIECPMAIPEWAVGIIEATLPGILGIFGMQVASVSVRGNVIEVYFFK